MCTLQSRKNKKIVKHYKELYYNSFDTFIVLISEEELKTKDLEPMRMDVLREAIIDKDFLLEVICSVE